VEVLKSTYSPELAMRLVDLWEMAGARKYPEINAFAKQTLSALFDRACDGISTKWSSKSMAANIGFGEPWITRARC
jgi:hypothetical protein